MIKVGLFFLNLILTTGFVGLIFWTNIEGDTFFVLIASTTAIISLLYCPLLKMLKQGEFGYFKGLGYLLLIIGTSQLLGFLVYAIADNAFFYRDYMALVIGEGEFVSCIVILIVLYSVSYGLCRIFWKQVSPPAF